MSRARPSAVENAPDEAREKSVGWRMRRNRRTVLPVARWVFDFLLRATASSLAFRLGVPSKSLLAPIVTLDVAGTRVAPQGVPARGSLHGTGIDVVSRSRRSLARRDARSPSGDREPDGRARGDRLVPAAHRRRARRRAPRNSSSQPRRRDGARGAAARMDQTPLSRFRRATSSAALHRGRDRRARRSARDKRDSDRKRGLRQRAPDGPERHDRLAQGGSLMDVAQGAPLAQGTPLAQGAPLMDYLRRGHAPLSERVWKAL